MEHFLKDGRLNIRPLKNEQAKKYAYNCDVLVIGTGTAGSIAALAAARQGLDVIAADKMKLPGGTGTFSCVFDYYYGKIGETAAQINEQAQKDERFMQDKSDKKISVNGSAKSLELIKLFRKNKVRFLADSTAFTLYMQGKNINGVGFITGDGICDIAAKTVIDTTGEVAILAGCKTIGGRRDGKMMNASKCCAVMKNGVLQGQWSNSGFLSDDRFLRSRQILEASTKPPFLYDNIGEKCSIKQVGSIIGEREVRRIRTKEVLDSKNIFNSCKNAVFTGFAPFDNTNKDYADESIFLQNWQVVAGLKRFGISYAVKAENMTVSEAQNLVIAGKVMGLTHDTASAVRLKGDMEQSGEAAAKIAEKMINHDDISGNIAFSGAKLYSLIKQNGKLVLQNLPDENDEIIKVLCSNNPEIAYFVILTACTDSLKNRLKAELENDGIAAFRAAIALGMLMDGSCKNTLKKIVAAGRQPIIRRFDCEYSWLCEDDLCDYDKSEFLLLRFGNK